MFEVRSISKSFPGVKALDAVSVSFAPGTIHALLGENGAGKSTLMKILCGIYGPDEGTMLLDGRTLVLHDTFDALAQRISIVHQEIQVVPRASIAENIMLDKLHRYRRGPAIDWKRLSADARSFMDMVELAVAPDTPVGELPAAQKQLAQIARALSDGARILLLDDPTSSLTLHEADRLFGLLRRLRDQGVTIVFVSHKLEEVMALCDVVTVLRDGRLIGTHPRDELTKDAIITMMIGRSRAAAGGGCWTWIAAPRCSRCAASRASCSTACPFRCTRGRSSACTAWSARGAPSLPRRSLASTAPRRDRSSCAASPRESAQWRKACTAIASGT